MFISDRLGWIGVDIGTHTIKLAQAVRAAGGIRLRAAAVIQRPDPWPADDTLGHSAPDSSQAEIHAALECGGFQGRNAACLLPMNLCDLRALNVPLGDDHERRAMIASELADEWAVQSAAREFDFWELEVERRTETSEAFNVEILSVTRPWIAQVAGDLRRARLDCWAIDGGPLAISRSVALTAKLRNSDRVMAVDWGFSNTTLSIVGNQRPLYARRVFGCGFRNCLEAVGTSLGITFDHAQHLVDSQGVTAENAVTAEEQDVQLAITEAIRETVELLVEQIRRTLRFLELQRRQLRPSSIWLMGGGASVRNIDSYLTAELGIPVHVWNVPCEPPAADIVRVGQAAIFGGAFALSALRWRAA